MGSPISSSRERLTLSRVADSLRVSALEAQKHAQLHAIGGFPLFRRPSGKDHTLSWFLIGVNPKTLNPKPYNPITLNPKPLILLPDSAPRASLRAQRCAAAADMAGLRAGWF